MSKARLSDPATYTPVGAAERMRMTRYRDRVDELQSFVSRHGQRDRAVVQRSRCVESTGQSDFDREGFLAVTAPFRILRDDNSPTGFNRVMKILSQHVRKDLADYRELV